MNRGGGTVFGTRRYRHTSMTAPDPNSKNYARNEKKRKMEAASGDGPKKEYTPRAPTVKKGVRSELKSAVQIQKDRNAKDKRREKTGRHFRGKPKKGR